MNLMQKIQDKLRLSSGSAGITWTGYSFERIIICQTKMKIFNVNLSLRPYTKNIIAYCFAQTQELSN